MSGKFLPILFCYHFDPWLVVEMGLEMEDIDLVSWTDISLQWLHCSCAAQGDGIGKRYHL